MRNGRTVLKDFNFSAESGDALLLMGPNGSGKSTLLRICAGLLAADSGTLALNGEATNEDSAALHRQHHYVGHKDGLKSALTIAENLEVWASLLGGPTLPDALDLALERFSLHRLQDTPVHYLSAGQRRRAALARLILRHRPIWLLDEPLNGLDAKHIAVIEQALSHHVKAGGLALVATHQMLNLPDAECSVLTLGRATP